MLLPLALALVATGLGGFELYRGTSAPADTLPEYREAHGKLSDETIRELLRTRSAAGDVSEDPDAELARYHRLSDHVAALERQHSEVVAAALPAWRRQHLTTGLLLLLVGLGMGLGTLGARLHGSSNASAPEPIPGTP